MQQKEKRHDLNANLLNTRRYSNAALERKESTDACQISAKDTSSCERHKNQVTRTTGKGIRNRVTV